MTTQMMIRVDPKLKDRLDRLARLEGKTANQVIRDLVETHLKKRDIAACIDDLWGRIGARLKSRGVKPADIGRVVKAARTKKA